MLFDKKEIILKTLCRWHWSTIRWFRYFFHLFYTKLCLFEKFIIYLSESLFFKTQQYRKSITVNIHWMMFWSILNQSLLEWKLIYNKWSATPLCLRTKMSWEIETFWNLFIDGAGQSWDDLDIYFTFFLY